MREAVLEAGDEVDVQEATMVAEETTTGRVENNNAEVDAAATKAATVVAAVANDNVKTRRKMTTQMRMMTMIMMTIMTMMTVMTPNHDK